MNVHLVGAQKVFHVRQTRFHEVSFVILSSRLVKLANKKLHSFFKNKRQFYKNKSLGFGKKFKNKLRTKPGLLSHRT